MYFRLQAAYGCSGGSSAIEACITVLRTGPDDAKASAMCVLANISYQEQHVEHLVEAGVITTVLDVMQSMNSRGKFYAALTLASFSDRLGVVASKLRRRTSMLSVVTDAAAVLVQELQRVGADEELKFDAVRALTRILRHKQHVDAVVAVGAVAALAQVHQNGSQDIKCEASVALDLISAERSQIDN